MRSRFFRRDLQPNGRLWSNMELEKLAPLCYGKIVNVSAWQDKDKEGGTYQERYFAHAEEYRITNWKAEARGLQGRSDEIWLDLEAPLAEEMQKRFDVVFNHTTLEHVFDIFTAWENLCSLSRDIVIVVVPFVQEQHGDYGDYWRFTPWCVSRMFERYGVSPAYMNYKECVLETYVICAAAREQSSIQKLQALADNKITLIKGISLGRGHFPHTIKGEAKALLRNIRAKIAERFTRPPR